MLWGVRSMDGSVWKPQASHFYFYFVGKCDVLARGLHGSSNLYYDKSHIVRLGSSSIKREPIWELTHTLSEYMLELLLREPLSLFYEVITLLTLLSSYVWAMLFSIMAMIWAFYLILCLLILASCMLWLSCVWADLKLPLKLNACVCLKEVSYK